MNTFETLDNILNPVQMEINIPYYEDNSRISNSALGYFIISPRYFKDKSEGEGYSLEGKFLENGTMIHKYILEKETFWDEYQIKKSVAPSSANMKKFFDCMVAGDTKIDAYKKSYATSKLSLEKIEELATELYDAYEDYFEELKTSGDKLDVSYYDLVKLKEIEKNISQMNTAANLIYPDKSKYEVHSEFHINWKHKSDLHCKSLIDRLILDRGSKTAYIVDLKTTAKIDTFHESAKMFGYYRQAAFYEMALKWYLETVDGENPNDWKIESIIVAISTAKETMNEVRVFNLKADLDNHDKNIKLIDSLMAEIKWHHDNNKFDSTREFYETGFNNIKSKWDIYE